MRLTLKASRLLAFGVVAAVIVGAVIAINFSKSSQKNSSSSLVGSSDGTLNNALPPSISSTESSATISDQKGRGTATSETTDTELSSGFTLQNFNRSETKDGKKLWEISGEKGLISTSGDKARIDITRLSFFRDDGSEVVLTAPKADLKIEGGLVSIANLSGGVFVEQFKDSPKGRSQDYSASSESATFDRVTNSVTTNSTTTINSRMVTLTSGALKADLNKKHILFFNGVNTVLKPNSKGFTLPGQNNLKDKVSTKPVKSKALTTPTKTKKLLGTGTTQGSANPKQKKSFPKPDKKLAKKSKNDAKSVNSKKNKSGSK